MTPHGRGRYWEEFTVGEVLVTGRRTVDGGDVSRFAGLTGDFNPLHVDIEVAKKTIHGERIAPGTLTTSLTFTTFAMLAFGTGMALLELNFKLPAAVKINDTLEVEIEILDKRPSRKYADKGGIVHQRMTTRNQHGTVVAEGEAKILISKVPSYQLVERKR